MNKQGLPTADEIRAIYALGEGALSEVAVEGVERRQVFDLPEVRLEVTEHVAEVKRCAVCGKRSQARFPAWVKQPTQYGARFRTQLAYFHSGQFIPLKHSPRGLNCYLQPYP